MPLPLLQSSLESALLQQVADSSHTFLSVHGTATLLLAPAGVTEEACHSALDSLVYARRIRRYTQLSPVAEQPCFLVLRPCDPGSLADSDPQGGCEAALAAP
jgi:hypothetical protein